MLMAKFWTLLGSCVISYRWREVSTLRNRGQRQWGKDEHPRSLKVWVDFSSQRDQASKQ